MADLRMQAIVGVIQIITNIYYVYKNAPVKLPIGLFFLALLYIFHSGYALELLLTDNSLVTVAAQEISESTFAKAQLFTQISIFFISIAYTKTIVKTSRFTKVDICNLSPTPFVLLFFITLPIYITATMMKLEAVSIGGYHASWEIEDHPLFHYFSLFINLCVPLVTILCVFYKKNKKILTILVLFVVLFGLYSMTSGHRITAISQVITLTIVYYGSIGDLKKRSVIILLVAAVVTITILPMISEVRYFGSANYENISEVYAQQSAAGSDNSLDASLKEYGYTVYSLVYPMEYAGSYYGYKLGLTYFVSPIALSLKTPEFIAKADWYQNSRIFVYSFPKALQKSLGGSCLGELYSNFGWFGCVFTIFIGFLLRIIDNVLSSVKKTNRVSFGTILIILWIPIVIVWVRGYFYPFVSFSYLFVYVIWLFAQKKRKNAIALR